MRGRDTNLTTYDAKAAEFSAQYSSVKTVDVLPGLAQALPRLRALDAFCGDGRDAEWSDGEVYLSQPRAGGDAWMSVDLKSGAMSFESTDRGTIAYLNDLHKGRNTGDAWRWFIDIFAIACVVFTLTGLVLLQMHSRHRPSTWPTVGLGAVVMVVLALIHY